jgi:hypothetical protein
VGGVIGRRVESVLKFLKKIFWWKVKNPIFAIPK